MSCTTNYPREFEGSMSFFHHPSNLTLILNQWMLFLVPNEDEDDEEEEGDTVFMPIKSHDDDEPVESVV